MNDELAALYRAKTELLQSLGLPITSTIYMYEKSISIRPKDETMGLHDNATPSLSSSSILPGTLSWTWSPLPGVDVNWTTKHKASEAYRILAEYAERAETQAA